MAVKRHRKNKGTPPVASGVDFHRFEIPEVGELCEKAILVLPWISQSFKVDETTSPPAWAHRPAAAVFNHASVPRTLAQDIEWHPKRVRGGGLPFFT
jgi:hypothetical protein